MAGLCARRWHGAACLQIHGHRRQATDHRGLLITSSSGGMTGGACTGRLIYLVRRVLFLELCHLGIFSFVPFPALISFLLHDSELLRRVVAPAIRCLRTPAGPPTILRRVIAFWISAIKSLAIWTPPHVFEEVHKTNRAQPAITNLDPTAAIRLIAFVRLAQATRLHGGPRHPLCYVRLSHSALTQRTNRALSSSHRQEVTLHNISDAA